MLEHQHKLSFLYTVECLCHLCTRRLLEVFGTGYIDGILAAMQHEVLIHQQMPSHLPFRLLHLFFYPADFCLVIHIHIIGVIVIAQYAHHAILRLQTTQCLLERNQFLWSHILQITRKADQVGMLGIDAIYIPLRHVSAPSIIGTYMDIAEMHDAVTLKRLRQIGHIDREMLHLKLSYPHRKAIDEAEESPYGKEDSYQFSPVACPMHTASKPAIPFFCLEAAGELHTFPSHKTGEGKDKLRNSQQCHHAKPDVYEHRIGRQEVRLQGEIGCVSYHDGSRQPI